MLRCLFLVSQSGWILVPPFPVFGAGKKMRDYFGGVNKVPMSFGDRKAIKSTVPVQ